GVGGGILACILQFIVLTIFNSSFRQLMQLYESSFELQGFGIANSFLLITIGVVISWTAALLASLRHIRAINP
ncbi:MAG: cell division protein, partial [SAR86 cluster bacterium]